MRMREERAARRARIGTVRLTMDAGERTGQMVFEADGISKSYGDSPVVRDFSTRILRGDRIGLIGPNGVGKTTLLRMLAGELSPDSGEIRRGANVQIAYFDQQRAQLDPERTVAATVADGNDTVTIAGVTRHIYGYLDDFLFPSERANSLVKALSGGERNRLLLARLLTQPANVLVLDEPTNDLDIETLELVEAMLAEFPGTLLVVSHDRTFLDHVVTSTLVFEGDGRIEEYVGGYEDWRRQKIAQQVVLPPVPAPRPAPAAVASVSSGAPPVSRKLKLSYNERREFEALPNRIAELEAEDSRLQAAVASPDFYRETKSAIEATLARIESLRDELHAAYARWDELDSRNN